MKFREPLLQPSQHHDWEDRAQRRALYEVVKIAASGAYTLYDMAGDYILMFTVYLHEDADYFGWSLAFNILYVTAFWIMGLRNRPASNSKPRLDLDAPQTFRTRFARFATRMPWLSIIAVPQYDGSAITWTIALGAFPQYIINMSHLLEHEQDRLGWATTLSLVGSLGSLAKGLILPAVDDDIIHIRRYIRGMKQVVGDSGGPAFNCCGWSPSRSELGAARAEFTEVRKWLCRRLVYLGPVLLLEIIHFTPIMIEHYVYHGLSSHGYVGYLLAFNVPKLLFVLMLEKGGDCKLLYKVLVPVLAIVLPCGVLLWRHNTAHDSRGAGLLAGFVTGMLAGLYFARQMLSNNKDAFLRKQFGWAVALGVMPLVPCVMWIEKGFKGGKGSVCAAKWNSHLLLAYMFTAYGGMSCLLLDHAGLWTRVSLGACYALVVLVTIQWLCCHDKLAALTAAGASGQSNMPDKLALDQMDSWGASPDITCSWQARLQRAAIEGATCTVLDLSNTSFGAEASDTELLAGVLAKCKALVLLDLSGCTELAVLPYRLGECTQLAKLNLDACNGLTMLPDLSLLPNLTVDNLPSRLSAWKVGGFKRFACPV
jgi:hypothetical protein